MDRGEFGPGVLLSHLLLDGVMKLLSFMLSHIALALAFFFFGSIEAAVVPFYYRGSLRHNTSHAVETKAPSQSINSLFPDSGRSQVSVPAVAESAPLLKSPLDKAGNYCVPTTRTSKKLVMAYYPDWVGSTFPPERIDFTRFDWIDFAFAVPDAKFALTWDDPQTGPDLLKRLVKSAHSHGTKVKLSLGGWSGSKHFSPAVATEENRMTFVHNILAAYTDFNLDGVDVDWEYPGRLGAPGNQWNSSDADNLLLFLQLLRSHLPPSARISAAVETTVFIGNTGKPMSNVSRFASVLDWVLLMNYDVWGSSSKPGPNAPLLDACGNSTQPDANAVAAVKAWTASQFPVDKLVLGLPSYGYMSTSTASRLRTRAKVKQKKVKSHSVGSLKVVNEEGSSNGQVQFNDLVRQGALIRPLPSETNERNTTPFIAGGGFERRWDSCSETPFLRSTASRQVITYDDLESLELKTVFAREVGMLGVNLFDVHGDTENWELTDHIRRGLGLA